MWNERVCQEICVRGREISRVRDYQRMAETDLSDFVQAGNVRARR